MSFACNFSVSVHFRPCAFACDFIHFCSFLFAFHLHVIFCFHVMSIVCSQLPQHIWDGGTRCPVTGAVETCGIWGVFFWGEFLEFETCGIWNLFFGEFLEFETCGIWSVFEF